MCGKHQCKDSIGKAELLYTACHVSFRDDRRIEADGLCKGGPLSFGIPDEYEKTVNGCCAGDRDELYPLCDRRAAFVPVPFSVGFFSGSTLLELIDAEELMPVLSAMQGALGNDMEQTKKVFLTVFLFAHGYASIIANNSLEYDEELINSQLEQAYRGAVLAAQENMS